MLLSNDLVLHTGSAVDIDNRFVVLGDPVGANDVVLDLCQTRGPGRGGREAARVLEVQELLQIGLGRLLQKDLAEADGDIGVSLDDGVTGVLGLVDGEDGEGMGHHCGCLGIAEKRGSRQGTGRLYIC